MRTVLVLVLVPALALALALALEGCSGPVQSTESPAGPDEASFAPVADALVRRCGSIDCHGSRYRNMRLYGFGGTRLSPTDRPDTPTSVTAAEAQADYDSVVSLEPDVTRQVAADKGANPERLTFVRKGRGEEAHKGGAPIQVGDDADRCVLSWLSGSVDAATCKKVPTEP